MSSWWPCENEGLKGCRASAPDAWSFCWRGRNAFGEPSCSAEDQRLCTAAIVAEAKAAKAKAEAAEEAAAKPPA